MNPINSKNQTSRLPEIVAVILVVGSIGYYFYSSQGSSVSTSQLFTISSATSTSGADVLNLLDQIQSLKIDTSFFQSPVYQSLSDFTIKVPPEPIGKSNPFVTNDVTTNDVPVNPVLASTTPTHATGRQR